MFNRYVHLPEGSKTREDHSRIASVLNMVELGNPQLWSFCLRQFTSFERPSYELKKRWSDKFDASVWRACPVIFFYQENFIHLFPQSKVWNRREASSHGAGMVYIIWCTTLLRHTVTPRTLCRVGPIFPIIFYTKVPHLCRPFLLR